MSVPKHPSEKNPNLTPGMRLLELEGTGEGGRCSCVPGAERGFGEVSVSEQADSVLILWNLQRRGMLAPNLRRINHLKRNGLLFFIIIFYFFKDD